MSVETVYGLYDATVSKKKQEKAKVSKNYILPLELMNDWRNCSVISDLVAAEQPDSDSKPHYAQNILSTVTNELLENAVKFSADRNKLVTLTLSNFSNSITIETTNIAHEKNAKSLKEFISSLQSKNLDDLYFEQLERSICLNHDDISGLGFLGIMKDYNANLGIKIEHRITSFKKRLNRTYDIYIKIALQKESLEIA